MHRTAVETPLPVRETPVPVLASEVVTLLGVMSAVLGFVAEANRLKVSDPNDVHIYSSINLAESHQSLYAEVLVFARTMVLIKSVTD